MKSETERGTLVGTTLNDALAQLVPGLKNQDFFAILGFGRLRIKIRVPIRAQGEARALAQIRNAKQCAIGPEIRRGAILVRRFLDPTAQRSYCPSRRPYRRFILRGFNVPARRIDDSDYLQVHSQVRIVRSSVPCGGLLIGGLETGVGRVSRGSGENRRTVRSGIITVTADPSFPRATPTLRLQPNMASCETRYVFGAHRML